MSETENKEVETETNVELELEVKPDIERTYDVCGNNIQAVDETKEEDDVASPEPFKRNLWKSIKLNWLFYSTLILSCVVLSAHTGDSITNHFLTMFLVSLIGYFVHYISHRVSFTSLYTSNTNYVTENNILNTCILGICRFFDYHDVTHHDTEINKVWYNIVFEFINNVVTQGGLIIALIYLGKQLSTTSIALWALMYASIHNINYLFVKPKTHANHHIDKHTSYGLDVYDILFNTKYDPDEIEVYNHGSINIVILVVIFVYFSQKF